ncbi:MBL fold metallo-hydrolase [Gordonia zhaorongruii]|uniref:MBL fold metallo-hydrolase n=1 Tax=Gordonia zhaorongruii TaxID=2597659 RepID=UPI001044B1AB|nr:MBL fold metallo-hydrolase [Gordonia zhaorongruii]
MPDLKISTITHGDTKTHLVSTSIVNWVILQDGNGVTLIDGGYPGHAPAVIESLRRIGSAPEEIRAALLTHAHVDHLGGLVRLRRSHPFDVFADPEEVGHARREYLEQADPSTIGPIAYRPKVIRWLGSIVPLGALDKSGLSDAVPFSDLSALPGSPVAVPTHGHTRGHSSFLAGDGEVLISGDAMISGHPIAKQRGPQCLGHTFTHDVPANHAAVASLADLDSVVVMPGHGPMLCGDLSTFVEQALTRTAG